MAIRHRKKAKRVMIIISLLCLISLIIVGIVIFKPWKKDYSYIEIVRLAEDKKQGESISEKDIDNIRLYTKNSEELYDCAQNVIGFKVKNDVNAGSIIMNSMIYKEEEIADDIRYQKFDHIEIFRGILVGDYIDIRINFINGEDYIVIEHKRIEGIEEDGGIVLRVNEEEILKMSSAEVDLREYTGTRVYAVKYAGDYQKPAESYYLLNDYVVSLAKWEPNIIKKFFTEKDSELRNKLEQNLKEFESNQSY